jgi:hypothetical protein
MYLKRVFSATYLNISLDSPLHQLGALPLVLYICYINVIVSLSFQKVILNVFEEKTTPDDSYETINSYRPAEDNIKSKKRIVRNKPNVSTPTVVVVVRESASFLYTRRCIIVMRLFFSFIFFTERKKKTSLRNRVRECNFIPKPYPMRYNRVYYVSAGSRKQLYRANRVTLHDPCNRPHFTEPAAFKRVHTASDSGPKTLGSHFASQISASRSRSDRHWFKI